MMNTVEVKNLSFAYTSGEPVLLNISFEVAAGEVFVIAGASGSGKTTLCRIICGVIPHAVKGSISGYVSVLDIEPPEAGLTQTSLRAGLVFQDADNQLICTTVEDELAFGLENICRPPGEIRSRVDDLMFEFGFGGLARANPAQLSDGQKKLLTVAAALAPDPPVLVLDEPMSGLDAEGRELVVAAIKRQKQQTRTIIIVEHDLDLLTFSDRWLLLDNGAAAVCGKPEELLHEKNLLSRLGLI